MELLPGFACRPVVLYTQERIGPFAIRGHSVDHGWHLGRIRIEDCLHQSGGMGCVPLFDDLAPDYQAP